VLQSSLGIHQSDVQLLFEVIRCIIEAEERRRKER